MYFFSEESFEDDGNPSEKSLELLDMQRDGAIIIASCKPILDDDDNPPHCVAAKEYLKKVGDNKFIVTMENPDDEEPLPLKYVITSMGPQKTDSSDMSSIVSSAAAHSVISTPQTYGK